MFDVFTARADEPNVIMNGEYIIAEINTQEDAVDIDEAPPINRLSEALEAVETAPAVYGGISLTAEDFDLLRRIMALEGHTEGHEGLKAIAEVVFNRMRSDRFPDTLRDVIYGENQFRSAKHLDKAKPYQLQYEAVDNALYGPYILSDDVYYFATTPKTEKIWGQIGGHIFCYAED